MKKVRWGILSTAKIGVVKVIPAMQTSDVLEISAISSRNLASAKEAAKKLNIPKAYGSYEELLADPDIDAVYNPLPNHMHLEWTIKAIQAGKHVLCEKPVGLSVAEAETMLAEANNHPELKVMEAFMYRFHPQWQKAKALLKEGSIGELKTIQSFFSYYNVDPNNIRNRFDVGGGGMLDIGCYCISLARFIFESEPKRVVATIEHDPVLKTDIKASGILDFGTGTSTFTCSTQLSPYQRVNICGSKGRIEIEIPFNAPPDKPTKLWLTTAEGTQEFQFDICDQYAIQGDLFSNAILKNTEVPTPFQDAVNNMKVIEAAFKSEETKGWVNC